MKQIYLTALLALALLSCTKKETQTTILCNVDNPVKDLPWLEKIIDGNKDDEYSLIFSATLEGHTVVYYWNCNPAANFHSDLFDCKGTRLGNTFDLLDKLEDKVIVWQSLNSKCIL